ncbi:uncharacterized protein [Dermacentor andersoni]|uniref:uncharacterized protein n=1 Tax=Dermacentor andersoni TaxID=34620 RepID=UPI002417BA34|nr:protein giant-like [Dermacentor andersoni]
MDHLSPNASCCPDRNFCGRSARGSAKGDREPPVQPLDFSLKSAAASSCSSPLSPVDDRRPSPDSVSLGAACSHPEASNPLPSPELHHRNPLLLIPRTTTNTPASTSPPAPFQNGYGRRPATTPLQFHPSVNASTSPPPSASSTTSKCERLGMDLYSVSDQFLPAAPATTTGLHHAVQAAEAGSAVFPDTCLRAEFVKGCQEGHHTGSRTTGSPSGAAGYARQLATTSPPPLSNGAATCRADNGEEGDPTSPENSNSSVSTITNGDTSTSGPVANGETAKHGGALTANGGVVAATGGPPNGGPTRNRQRRPRLPKYEDSAYRERRRRNNEAAKRSRDTRKAKEKLTAMRVAFLEQENARLHYEIGSLHAKLNLLLQPVYRNLFSQQLQQQTHLQSFPPAHVYGPVTPVQPVVLEGRRGRSTMAVRDH